MPSTYMSSRVDSNSPSVVRSAVVTVFKQAPDEPPQGKAVGVTHLPVLHDESVCAPSVQVHFRPVSGQDNPPTPWSSHRMIEDWKFTGQCTSRHLERRPSPRSLRNSSLGDHCSCRAFSTLIPSFIRSFIHLCFIPSEADMKRPTRADIVCAVLRLCFLALQLVAQTVFRFCKPGKSMPPIDDPLLLDSATTLARKIRTRQVTSVQVVKAFIKRIQQVNPMVNCIVDVRFDAALQEARAIDEEIATGKKTEKEMEEETPLLGVPFTFKSCIGCKGMRFTAGLVSRRNCVAQEDAEVLTLMKEAGGIPLASTNTSEMCVWWESYNCVHGTTSNPYDSNRTAGGSSGGEGCVQAFGGSPMGLGSDLGGSIRIPALFNGVFGHKPTNGCSATKGHYPIPRYEGVRKLLVIGPMSRHACDLRPMLKIISKNLIELDEQPDLKKLRYFYMDNDGGNPITRRLDPDVKTVLEKAVKYLRDGCGVSVQKVDLPRMKYGVMYWYAMMKAKEGPVVAKELANFRGSTNLFYELFMLAFGANRHTLPVLIAGIMDKYGLVYGDSIHSFFLNECNELKKEFEALLGSDGVFIFPTLPTAAPYHVEARTHPFDFSFTSVFNCLGFPVTHCPLGLNSKGLPIGVQVVAPEMCDRFCLAVAEELERGFGGWVPPPLRTPPRI